MELNELYQKAIAFEFLTVEEGMFLFENAALTELMFVADELRKKQVPHGKVTLHRPSMVVGHAETGKVIHFQVFYHLCEFLSGRHTRGLIPADRKSTRLNSSHG